MYNGVVKDNKKKQTNKQNKTLPTFVSENFMASSDIKTYFYLFKKNKKQLKCLNKAETSFYRQDIDTVVRSNHCALP